MSHVRKAAFLATIAILGLIGPPRARADIAVMGSFDANGSLGFLNSNQGLSISYGSDGQGSVYQLDGFVNVQGMNYNSDVGNSADLDFPPPSGIGYTFASSQPTADQLLLSYTFVNNTGANLPGFEFLHYVDPDDGNNYPYEYATVNGLANLGQGNNPTSFQVSDASYGTLFTNLGSGVLSNNNDLPSAGQYGDVSFGLGFNYGTLAIGQSVTFDILLSDDGSTLGNFSITQNDEAYPGDSLTVSGAVVPEPRSLILLAIGSILAIGHKIRRRIQD